MGLQLRHRRILPIQLEDSEDEGLTETPLVTGGAYQSFYLKGSNVYVYELSDGRTLQQTSDVFFSELVRDDGFYKFQTRDLATQYAMIVVDGFYNNVVTGKVSNARIVLKAIVDMRKYSSVNVNVISHLELERASKLTKLDGYTFKKGERQARREVMQQFHMDTTGMGETATLNMFAADEGCSKLLALTIMLLGDRKHRDQQLVILLERFPRLYRFARYIEVYISLLALHDQLNRHLQQELDKRLVHPFDNRSYLI